MTTITWAFPRLYVPTPVWRVRTGASAAPARRQRREAAIPARPVARIERAELDRDSARALVEAGFMPLERYIERFGNDQV